MTDETTKVMCDCERSHNGFGMAGRECDCPACRSPTTSAADRCPRCQTFELWSSDEIEFGVCERCMEDAENAE